MLLAHKKLIGEKLVEEEDEQNVKQEAKKEKYLVTSLSYSTALFKSHCCIWVASIKCFCIQGVFV